VHFLGHPEQNTENIAEYKLIAVQRHTQFSREHLIQQRSKKEAVVLRNCAHICLQIQARFTNVQILDDHISEC